MGRLAGRNVIVSGAGSGIGRATAEVLAAQGAHVLCGDIATDAVEEVARAIGGAAHRLDVTDPASWAAIVTAAAEASGGLHALVNCAGVEAESDTIDGCTPEEWERVMRVNLDGTFLGTKAAAEAMRGHGSGGAIVNISSVLAIVADGETLAYGAGKAAVRGLTRSTALAVAADGIRCNSIHPGYIRTPMTERWLAGLDGAEAEAQLIAMHPLGRLGEPRDIAELALYLVSDDAAYVTGAELAIDGGYLAV
jgi:NAD(P)-dependent dehydrogenase (short-subunit alcohol dehydrogenase family)